MWLGLKVFRGPHRICTLAKEGWVDIRGKRSSEDMVELIILIVGAESAGYRGSIAGRTHLPVTKDLIRALEMTLGPIELGQAYRTGSLGGSLSRV